MAEFDVYVIPWMDPNTLTDGSITDEFELE